MKLPNYNITSVRKTRDGVVLKDDEPGGVEFVTLYVDCPKCSTPQLLAKWVDKGGNAVGSLTCNECDFYLLTDAK